MVYEEKKETENEDPFFNMARKTLDCLDKIKQQMLFNDSIYPIDSPEKQKIYIELIKKFYMFAIPLPKVDEKDENNKLDKMEDEVLDLKLERKTGIKQGSQISRHIYSEELDLKLNKIFIKINRILKPFFMPPKRDDDGL